jgi:hypothetical protein
MTEYTDWSGKISLVIFKEFSYLGSHHSCASRVHHDYVLVGGGAHPTLGDGSSGFITESRPNTDLKTWHSRSKDHITPGNTVFNGYSIGMRIAGVSAAYLRSKMRVFTKESSIANHPNTSVSVPSNYLLIGGGAEVKYSGTGNLLVHSYPKGNTWHVKSKDHQVADRATIKAYAIGIENISFPNVGHIETFCFTDDKYTSGGFISDRVFLERGWALTCPGAKTDFYGEGRMITGIYPDYAERIIVSSTDHIQGDRGTLSTYALGVRKRK